MKEILLTGGQTALVDDADFERLNSYKWHLHNGYASHSTRHGSVTIRIKMHTALLGLPPAGYVTDHISRDKLDNRRENLRFVSKAINTYNRVNRRMAAPGVYKFKNGWSVRFTIHGKSCHFGFLKTEAEAKSIAALLRASLIYHELTKGETDGIRQRHC